MRGLRILLVGNDPEYFLMHRLSLAQKLAADGVDLHVAIPFRHDDGRFRDLGFALHALKLRRGSKNPLEEARTLADLATVSRRVRPLLVHHVTIKPVAYGSIVARCLGTPAVVNSVTGLGYVFSSGKRDARIMKSAVLPVLRAGCNRENVMMLFENTDNLNTYCSFGITTASRARVIPSSGIDPAAFASHEHRAGNVTVMLLSRMLWDKGVREFVEAARIVKQQVPATRFVLVGATDPNPESIPADVLRLWHDEGVVEYWGWRSDVPATLKQADVLCLPSYREGLSRALLEGGAAGLPLITTDVPGCRDAVLAGVSALVVPPRDAENLARAMLDLVTDAKRRTLMGAAARADVAARFSIESVVEQTRSAYKEILARVV